MMKTIPAREFTKFRQILSSYFRHLKQHPHSLICRFFGLYKVKWKTSQHVTTKTRFLVVMENMFKSHKIGIKYDLKGSTFGRTFLDDD
jgi:1-phosphatidylinositol-4-phosphate 5-kinase